MSNLETFITNKMRMTSIYQPAVIRCLLKNEGRVSLDEIGKFISKKLSGDTKKAKYYAGKLKIYPKQVLAKHDIAIMTVDLNSKNPFIKEEQFIINTEYYSEVDDPKKIIRLCDKKIKDYLEKKRG